VARSNISSDARRASLESAREVGASKISAPVEARALVFAVDVEIKGGSKLRATSATVVTVPNASTWRRVNRNLTSIKDGRCLTMTAALLAVCIFVASSPAFAQTAIGAVRTCSQAYGICFDYCSNQFGAGGQSAKCTDKCAYRRAICDRGGCFDSAAVSRCGLERR
jgi:hypothetical protein